MEETLGRRIMTNRKRLALTQDKLAEMLGVTAQAVSKWENDQSCPDITMLPQLADIFGITTDELLGRVTVAKTEAADDYEQSAGAENTDGSGIQWHYESGKAGAVMLAILVLLVGALTFLARLLEWDVSFWNILWPCSILMLGLGGLFHNFTFFSLGCVLLGGYFLLDNLNVIRWEMSDKLVFPVLILVFGIALLVDALKKRRYPRQTFHRIGKGGKSQHRFSCGDEQFTSAVTFGESRRQIVLPRLSKGDISCSFGSMVIDLSGCEEFADTCSITANCSFGELELQVPRHIRVEPDNYTAFASVDIHGHPDPEPKGVITLKAKVSFGEIIIRYL